MARGSNETVLIMLNQNEITDVAFYALGLMSDEEVTDMMKGGHEVRNALSTSSVRFPMKDHCKESGSSIENKTLTKPSHLAEKIFRLVKRALIFYCLCRSV